ncbi:MFS transporter [Actinoplanes sp. NPDC020271]|uniref:MFS transporter n=1 Tax=Actinoplanes sp. NPDC020271 TaxID=3363896 RepID=UPI00378BA469
MTTTRVQPESPYRWRWPALIALLVAEAMNLLDATIVTVAAPVIHDRLGGSAADIQWYTAAYTLSFSVLLIAGGRLGDIYRRRAVFQVGVAGFLVTSVACALAPSTGALIAARVVQGAMAALAIPQTIGMIKEMFAGPEMSRAMGSIGPVMGLAAVCGPIAGGVLTHADLFGMSWRSVFLVNAPLGLAVLAVSPLLREPVPTRRPSLDLAGNALAVAGSALVVHPLIQGSSSGWRWWSWLSIAGGVAVLAILVWHQRRRDRRRRSALVEVSLFANPGFPAALATSVLFFAVVNGLTLVVVLHLQLGLGLDVLPAGLSLLPWSAAMAVASWVAGTRLVPRYGARVMYAGLVALSAGTVLAATIYQFGSAGAFPRLVLAGFVVLGAGQGLFAVPFFTTALHRVHPQETGSAAGLLNAVQQLGATLGTAVLGTVFLRITAASTASHGIRDAFWVAAGLLLVTGVATRRMLRHEAATQGCSRGAERMGVGEQNDAPPPTTGARDQREKRA